MNIPAETKRFIVLVINEAVAHGCKKTIACKDIGVNIRTFQRWEKLDTFDDQRKYIKKNPPNKLTDIEKRQMEKILNTAEFKDMNPWEIVPTLADKDIYIASESSFYRLMRKLELSKPRSKAKPKSRKKPNSYLATGPNQVWTWDITYLKTDIKGIFYYLYMILDIYSRKIVGWRIHEEQSAKLSSPLMEETYLLERIKKDNLLVLHSDNGAPMKGATMLATLQKLGVVTSFSRSQVSDDNSYSESLFKTLKYTPRFPLSPFKSIESANEWVSWFVSWYNNERLHGEIKYVTPISRHNGKDSQILKNRQVLYEKSRSKNPARWSGKTKNWTHNNKVYLNPTNEQKDMIKERKNVA